MAQKETKRGRGRPKVYDDRVSKHISVQIADLELFEKAAEAHDISFSEYANLAMEFLALDSRTQKLMRMHRRIDELDLEREKKIARLAEKAKARGRK